MPAIKKYLVIIWAHRLIISLALVMTALVSLPVILFPLQAGPAYRGINIAHFGTDEHYYLTRAKEILEGHGLGNIILREGKDTQEPQFTYAEYVLLLPLRMLGLGNAVDVPTLYNIYNFLGVFILVVLIYSFAFELNNNKRYATLAALFVVGGYSIIYNKTVGSPELNAYGRAMFPYISSIAFFVFTRYLARALKMSGWREAVKAGIAFGVLFYVFFYAWSFAIALLGSLTIVFSLKRDWTAVKKLAVIAGVGLALGAYNLVRLLLFYRTEHGRQLSFFLWSFKTHAPVMSKIGLAMAVLLGVFWYRKRHDAILPVIAGFVLAGWVALNQQIITGQVVQYGHYYWFFIVPTSIALGWYMLWKFISNRRWQTFVFFTAFLVVFVNSAAGQYRSAQASHPRKLYEQGYRPIIDVLRSDNNPGAVLAPDGARGLLVTIYTPHDLLWNTTALVYNTPPERTEETLLWYLFINKESRDDPHGYLTRSLADPQFESDGKFLYESLEGILSGWDFRAYEAKSRAPDAELLEQRRKLLNKVRDAYGVFRAHPNAFLRRHGVRYIVWDKENNPEWDLDFLDNTTLLHNSETLSLYRLD